MRIDPSHLDDGIRDSVLMLWRAGYKTFTSCEGGHGHSFRHSTIGIKLIGDYFEFRDGLAEFLRKRMPSVRDHVDDKL